MAFSKQQLQKFANLIRIEISDEKLAEMNIDSVIEWLDKLQKIDTTGVEPMNHPIDFTNVMREDIKIYENTREELMSNAPDVEGEFFKVPKIN